MNKGVLFLQNVTNEDGKTSFRKGDFCVIVNEGKEYITVSGSNTSETGITSFPKSVEGEIFTVHTTIQVN